MWGHVPQRNKNFTGRTNQLSELRERLMARRPGGSATAVVPQAVYGLGGVGKTQLAMEYAYQYAHEYDVVWWVSADQPGLIRAGLAALAPRLGLTVALDRTEDAVAAVLDALRQGTPFKNWLIVFDNAEQPESLTGLQPQGPGHLLITSRSHRWQSRVDTLEIAVFTRAESVEFLDRRVPGIQREGADRLAEALGDLPLALEQAGALQAESGIGVDDYLELFEENARQVLSENLVADYPHSVVTTWNLARDAVGRQNPNALELLRRCAFFGAEPIARDLFSNGKFALDGDIRDFLSNKYELARATRELGRYALARIDNSANTLQVHRLMQRLIRDDLSEAEAERMEHDVHLILTVADPNDPENVDTWPAYADLYGHVVASGVVHCQNPESRELFINVVRYLYRSGAFSAGLAEADHAIEHWTQDAGADDPNVLVMCGIKADLLWMTGRYAEAYELRRPTLESMRRTLGPEHEATLIVLNGRGADLRIRGEFRAALELDEESVPLHQAVFAEHPFTFYALNNLAIDYGLNSRYERALEQRLQNYEALRIFYGGDDHVLVVTAKSQLAQDQRQAGLYLQGRETAEQAYRLCNELVARGRLFELHPLTLAIARCLAVNRRKAGDFPGGLVLAREVYDKYTRIFAPDHPDRLAAAIILGNALRAENETDDAVDRIERTVSRYGEALGADHPYTHGNLLNLALVRRQENNLAEARELLEKALAGLTRSLGPEHHYTLTCVTNLATAVSESGDVEAAQRMGESTLTHFRSLLGPNHPHTLVCATNYSLDLRQLGRAAEADDLYAETIDRYQKVLGKEHPDVLAAMNGARLDFDFEPPAL
ncbi:FxSxx-COOH system tetratricopeptide repeat protein [Pseudofrankia inefficax]|uniref:FxSxx-COOH system tetratricopeptide repeat protein n=1 Tax=Pseudofrankia inefficax (strain DSM 45817 / CECT 9037 / DDB 130130 / EuI1c) TaxID=298654 RepID=UPI001E57E87E|nr:FxSxx-COOH system tetratricopeptide repeat protein [Pseudofrankia inefficax]